MSSCYKSFMPLCVRLFNRLTRKTVVQTYFLMMIITSCWCQWHYMHMVHNMIYCSFLSHLYNKIIGNQSPEIISYLYNIFWCIRVRVRVMVLWCLLQWWSTVPPIWIKPSTTSNFKPSRTKIRSLLFKIFFSVLSSSLPLKIKSPFSNNQSRISSPFSNSNSRICSLSLVKKCVPF